MRPFRYRIIVVAIVFSGLFLNGDRIAAMTDVSGIPLESHPGGIAINNDTGTAVVANEKEDSVSAVDIATRAIRCAIPVGKAPAGVAIDNSLNLAVVTISHDYTVSVIDLTSCLVSATVPAGKDPGGIAIDQISHRAFITNHKDDTVSVFDLADNQVKGTIPVGKEPVDIAIDSVLNLALVVNEKDDMVSVIDLNDHQVKYSLLVGKKPRAIDINPETHLAVIANEKDNSITVIDLQTWSLKTIPVGKHPVDVALNSLDNKALVICDEDRILFLVDLTTNALVGSYGLNRLSQRLAVDSYANVAAVTDDKTDSLTLIQLPNPIPEIASIIPAEVHRGSAGERVTIAGNRFIKTSQAYLGNRILETTFLNNHLLEARIPEDMLLKAGAFQISVANPAPEGGSSIGTDILIINPQPAISVLAPLEIKAGTQGQTLTIHGNSFFDDTEIYFGGVKRNAAYISNTKLQMDLSEEDLEIPGEYEITAYNPAPGGGSSNKAVLTVKPFFEMSITSPLEGDTINRPMAMVKGTIGAYTKDIGIRVNGVLADIQGNVWTVNNVPLTIGQNTITAVVSDPYGNTMTKTISVSTNDISQPIAINANILSGTAPLTTYFSVSTVIPNTIVGYRIDYEGDGTIDYAGDTFENISHTFTAEGVYYPTVTVIDDQGNTYSDTIAITVLNRTELDALLKKKWEKMKIVLAKKDIEGALHFFTDGAQEKYRTIFENLRNQLPTIMQTFVEFNTRNVYEIIAEYEIVANEGGILYSYPGIFIRNNYGIWKFSDF